MERGKKYACWLAVLLIVPLLGSVYYLFEDSRELYLFGNTYDVVQLFGWPAWANLAWQAMQHFITAGVSLFLIATLSKHTPILYRLVLSELAFMNLYYLINCFLPTKNYGYVPSSLILFAIVAVISLAFLIKYRNSLSLRERHEQLEHDFEQLKKNIKSLNRNELSELTMHFFNVKLAATKLSAHNLETVRKILIDEATEGNTHLSEVYEELENQ